MRNFVRVCYAFLARDMAVAASYRLDVFLRLFSVLFLIAILGFASRLISHNEALDAYGGYLPYATLGVAVMNLFQSAFRGCATALRNEQMTGTLEAVIMTPARLPSIIAGSVLWNIVLGLMTLGVYLGAIHWCFGVEIHGNWLAAAALTGLTIFVFSCFGVISASFIMAFKRGDPIPFLVGTMSALLGGVFFPVQLLPGWLQGISRIVPVTYGLHGLREVLLRGAGWSAVLPQLGALALFAAIALPLCIFSFRLALGRARREGSLLLY